MKNKVKISGTSVPRFATRMGVIAVTVGSAVGLGNIWRFPYEAGVHGGGAFLLVYLVFIAVMGIPVVCAEMIIGRKTHSNVHGAFAALSHQRFWRVTGVIGITGALAILGFYSVVAGWTLEYLRQSLTSFSGIHSQSLLHARFDAFATNGWLPAAWAVMFLALNHIVLARGVQKGIERMSNLLMPMLFVIMLVFCVNSLMMPGMKEGLTFLFKPDFSQITPSVCLGAMGQAFFSLSLGLGTMITYSAYFNDGVPLVRTASVTAVLDTLTAILAGIMIFPAVFTYGEQPAAGPRLVFEVLPAIFADMTGGQWWSVAFFLLLFIASLTSTVSMSEIPIAYLVQQRGMSRRGATLTVTLISMALGVVSAMSFGPWSDFTICGLTFFNFLDFLSSNILLPLGGMIISVFVGWVLDRAVVNEQLGSGRQVPRRIVSAIVFCLRWVAPAGIAIIFITGLIG